MRRADDLRDMRYVCLVVLSVLLASILPASLFSAATAVEPPGDDYPVLILSPSTKDLADSLGTTDTTDLVYVPASAFLLGDSPRATLYGDLPLARTHIDPLRGALVGAVFLGGAAYLHLNMKNAWWESRATFHLKNDWDDVLQIDKAGHAFAGYMMSYGFSEGLMAAGTGWDASVLWGASLGLVYQTYVELEDGFSEGWGFSLTDMASNTFGASLLVAQHYLPALQNVTLKYQYVPPAWVDAPRLSTTWIDDYNTSTFWLSFNIRNLLPAPAKEYWPSWLNVAFGYGIRIDESTRKRRYILALDYDLVKLLPDGGHVWNWFRQTLNFVKLPSPAIEFSDKPRVFLLFPFRI